MKRGFFCSVVVFAALFAWSPLYAQECNDWEGFSCSSIGCGDTSSSCGFEADLGCDVSCGSKKKSPWNFGGWVEAGIYGSSHGNGNRYARGGNHRTNAQTWMGDSANTWLMGPARQTGFQMNQAWLYLEKELDTKKGFDIGGRVDIMYGTDGIYPGSRGLEINGNGDPWGDGDYMFTIPQLYAEVGYRSLSVKLGKFYTPVGYEGVAGVDRFFYSASYAFQPVPTAQSGALATWEVSDSFSVFGGITCGFDDTGYASSFFHDVDGGAAVFGFDYDVNDSWSVGYGGLWGKRKNTDWGRGVDRDFYYHSLIIKYVPNECWDYTFEWFLENSRFEGAGVRAGDYTYGIHQQLIRKINDRWAVGFRGEWAKLYGDVNSCELTLGTNWTPNEHLLVRPEIRYDFSDEKIFDYNNKKNQFGFGMSAIVRF